VVTRGKVEHGEARGQDVTGKQWRGIVRQGEEHGMAMLKLVRQ